MEINRPFASFDFFRDDISSFEGFATIFSGVSAKLNNQ
jgi:hypothetical protein